MIGKKFRLFCLSFLLFISLYTVNSYLVWFRDSFVLERIAHLSGKPQIFSFGLKAAAALHVNSLSPLIYFISITGLFFVYFKFIHMLKNQNQIKPKSICLLFLAASLICLFSFPSLSTDIFDYINYNRVFFVHHANPWKVAPITFLKIDDFMYLGSWQGRASVYGPALFLFSSLVQFLSGDSIIKNIFFFKLENLVLLNLTAWLIYKVLSEHYPRKKNHWLLFALNPLIIIEVVGNAHNDAPMAFLLILGWYFFKKKKFALAGLFLALSSMIKVATIFLLPIIIFKLISLKKINAAKTIAASALLTLILGFSTLGLSFINYFKNLDVQLSLYLRSLSTLIRYFFTQVFPLISLEKATWLEKLIKLPLLLTVIFFSFKNHRRKSGAYLFIQFTLLYLIFISSMIWPWYLIWFFPLLPFIKSSRLKTTALLISFTAMFHYVVYFYSLYLSPLNMIWQLVLYLAIVFPAFFIWKLPQKWYTKIARYASI